jgi:fatty acid-binding protein DegV
MMLNNVLFAKEEAEKGTSIEDICSAVEERKHKGTVLFIPENLTALKNGGRISPAIAAVGNVIGLKPVITLTEGELVKVGMTTVVKKAFNDHIAKIKDNYPVDEYDYTLVSFDGKEAIFEAIYNTVKQIDENAAKGIVPINVCAHCGPGTIGLLVSPKINGKRIGEFL